MQTSEEGLAVGTPGSSSEERLAAIKEELHDLRDLLQIISGRVEILWRQHKGSQPKREEEAMKTEHVEPLREPPGAAIPAIGAADLFRWLPVLMKLLDALNTGKGTFSTWSPRGRRWVVVTDKEPTS